MSKIISIGTAVPEYGTLQDKILDFMIAAYADVNSSRKLKFLFNSSGINTRYSVIPDFDLSLNKHILFNGKPVPPNIEERSQIFKEYAVSLAFGAVRNLCGKLSVSIDDLEITHLITVSCTGLYAPGIDVTLIEQMHLPTDIFHTSFNFLGCNAAFPALRLADMIVRTDENAKVLIVCVELCTLHFQPKDNHDNLLSNTIFGDGAAAVVVVSDKHDNQSFQDALTIKGFYSLLLNKGRDLMAWNITPLNFEMILNAKVPEFIGDEVDEIIKKTARKLNFLPEEIGKWAIHPGGKKILDIIQEKLHLKEGDLRYSYKVLEEYGNMSSPTILFVLNELMHAEHFSDETIFSIGFGPGLSIETAFYTYAR